MIGRNRESRGKRNTTEFYKKLWSKKSHSHSRDTKSHNKIRVIKVHINESSRSIIMILYVW